MENRYNHHKRRKYSLKVHIVLVTKYRKQILKGSIADDACSIGEVSSATIQKYIESQG
jgi:REP element-mobilizing transposase RayT